MAAAAASHFTVFLWTLRNYLFFGGSVESVNGFQ
jgi:prepilin-type processing-associated H-X9-DG protein